MHALQAAVQNDAAMGFDWGGLAVPVIAGAVAIVVAIYNTRGETTALRRLKAMNDVIDKLPKESAVLALFTAARDDLAQRVAVRMGAPRGATSRFVSLGFAGILGAVIFAGAIYTLYEYLPASYSTFELIVNMTTGALLGGLLFVSGAQLIRLWIQLRGIERQAAKIQAELRSEK